MSAFAPLSFAGCLNCGNHERGERWKLIGCKLLPFLSWSRHFLRLWLNTIPAAAFAMLSSTCMLSSVGYWHADLLYPMISTVHMVEPLLPSLRTSKQKLVTPFLTGKDPLSGSPTPCATTLSTYRRYAAQECSNQPPDLDDMRAAGVAISWRNSARRSSWRTHRRP